MFDTIRSRRALAPFTTVLAVVGGVAATPAVESTEWTVDPAHTSIGFSVKHFFTPVQGRFDDFTATVDFDPEDPGAASVDLVIEVASVNTNNEKRDAHLMSEDFFNVAEHPRITFRSTEVRDTGEGTYVVAGDLTIKGITQRVELPVELLGLTELPEEMRSAFGGIARVASFEGGMTIDRRDFEVGVGSWAATLVVGGDVDIQLAVEANQ